MDTLTPEIVRDIAYKSIQRNECASRWDLQYGTTSIPLTLSHVCRTWRCATLEFGTLWSYLSFQYNDTKDGVQKCETLMDIFETCLQRTNGCPINFSIRIDLMDAIDDEDEHAQERCTEANRMAEHIISSLLLQQHRWQDVNFSWSCGQLSSGFRGIQLDNMHLLRSLRLSFFLSSKERKLFTAVIDIASSSRLRRFELDGDFLLRFGKQPMDLLTYPCELSFARSHAEEHPGAICLNLLRLAPNLKQLNIHVCVTQESPSTPIDDSQDILEHGLQCFAFAGNNFPLSLSEKTTFPSLTALRFAETTPRQELEGQLLLNFIRLFTPALTFLEIRNMHSNISLLIQTLSLLPTLRVLRVSFSDEMTLGSFLELLTMKNDNSSGGNTTIQRSADASSSCTLCPLLHSLRIEMNSYHFARSGEAGIARICRLLASRRGVLKTFQTTAFLSDALGLGFGRDFYNKLKTYLEMEGITYSACDSDDSNPFKEC